MKVCCTAGLILCLTALTGCSDSDSEKTGGTKSEQQKSTEKTKVKKAEAKPDDPVVVAALEKLGAKLKKNEAGSVVKVDLTAVSYTPEDLEQLAGLPSLDEIDLAKTEPGVEGLSKLKNLTQLKILRLRQCMISEEGMAELAKLKNLDQMYLINNSSALTDDALAHVAGLTKLRVLDLRGCVLLGDEGLKHLQALENLQRLKIRSPEVTDTGVGYLKGLVKLKGIALFDTKITDAAFENLTVMKDLDEISVMRTGISDKGLVHLEGLTKLKQLILRDTLVNGEGLAHLTGAKELWKLDVSEGEFDDDGLENIAAFPNLKNLNLWKSVYITDAGLAHLAGLTKLQVLNLEETNIGNAGLEHLSGLTSLQSLNLKETKITDEGLAFLQGFSQLKTLELARTDISDEAVGKLQSALPNCDVKR